MIVATTLLQMLFAQRPPGARASCRAKSSRGGRATLTSANHPERAEAMSI
jgi:hypothetical protein